jgi:hypothetical protein
VQDNLIALVNVAEYELCLAYKVFPFWLHAVLRRKYSLQVLQDLFFISAFCFPPGLYCLSYYLKILWNFFLPRFTSRPSSGMASLAIA